MRSGRFILGVALGLVLTMGSVEACPVCFSAKGGTREAFIITTVLLSCLPWAMVGGFVVWVRRKSKRQASS